MINTSVAGPHEKRYLEVTERLEEALDVGAFDLLEEPQQAEFLNDLEALLVRFDLEALAQRIAGRSNG